MCEYMTPERFQLLEQPMPESTVITSNNLKFIFLANNTLMGYNVMLFMCIQVEAVDTKYVFPSLVSTSFKLNWK